jgi:flavorubredoxin
MGLEIDMIAPDHGLIWRSHIKDVLQAYSDWSQNKGRRKALVIYDTMWESTQKMAKAITTGINMSGVSVKLINLAVSHRSDVMTDVLNAKAVVLGCATLNNGLLPRMAGFLMYMRGLKPTNKIGAAFGSFGWSGEGVKLMNAAMEDMISSNRGCGSNTFRITKICRNVWKWARGSGRLLSPKPKNKTYKKSIFVVAAAYCFIAASNLISLAFRLKGD